MKDNEQMDQLMKMALSPSVEPDASLNQKIVSSIREKSCMKKLGGFNFKKTIMLAAVLVVVLSVSVFATIKLIEASDVTKALDDKKLTDKFSGEGANMVNETVTAGKYDFTFMGIVSGNNISDYIAMSDDTVLTDRTYAIVAIAKNDGTQMPKTSDDDYGVEPFFISPLIKGLKPWRYNIMSMNGGYQDIVVDGIMYRLIECDNIEMFADRDTYLCVMTDWMFKRDAYNYDEATGEITPNKGYDGINILFKLPLDKSKADNAKADEYIKQLGFDD